MWAEHAPSAKQYTLGIVPQFAQRKLFQAWQPLVKELEARTGFSIHIVGSPKIPAFEKRFMAGAYDFAYMNPYHLLLANKTQGYIPLVRDGSRELKGVLVVKKNSPIKSLNDLEKKVLAFPSPNALGASLLMRADLVKEHGLNFVSLYVQTHSSVYLNVALDQTEAGGGVLSTLNAQPKELKDKLRILYETQGMPTHPVVAHPRVSKEDREIFRRAWLDLASSQHGKALLERIPMYRSISTDFSDYEAILQLGLEEFYVVD
ncbi:phosphate/phosphite/phosphonate ABC transporter substrate-binding protein [Pontibacterium sp. N1Y112]|uniref:Phosphate/phosphite/phosphonate ABC transporter substrate-binding protein n=1 Tax=Pontibacterium sinense TaxID=2781979 RepID=A0A8J7FR89_9GAMM|nr:phosphate/phosphite/phosphonate ABC transporter substrate-binding protein [Pontibacterium sinense]